MVTTAGDHFPLDHTGTGVILHQPFDRRPYLNGIDATELSGYLLIHLHVLICWIQRQY